MIQKFWMVQRNNNNADTLPRTDLACKKHYNKVLAENEMKRLASCFPGAHFVLLEAVEVAIKTDVQVTKL